MLCSGEGGGGGAGDGKRTPAATTRLGKTAELVRVGAAGGLEGCDGEVGEGGGDGDAPGDFCC